MADGTGSLRLVWFDQPYAQGLMRLDTDYVIYAEVSYPAGPPADDPPADSTFF